MNSSSAVGKAYVVCPMLLGSDPVPEMVAMAVRINKPGHDGFTTAINYMGTRRNIHLPCFSDRTNDIVFNQQHTVFDHFHSLHGYDPGSGERNSSVCFIRCNR